MNSRPKPALPPKPSIAPKPPPPPLPTTQKPVRKKTPPPVPKRVDSFIRRQSPQISSDRNSPVSVPNRNYINVQHLPVPLPRITRRSTSEVSRSEGNSSRMATSKAVSAGRIYYGKDEAIDVVMEDITNVDPTAVTEELSPSSSSTSDSSNGQPNVAVAHIVPIAKARTKILRSFDSGSDSDDSALRINQAAINAQFLHPPSEPTIMERIIRTHPVWYFTDGMNRETASVLLADAQPGNFIVRPSSKSQCVALSVRVSQSSGRLTNHFIIEMAGQGKIRLNGSMLSFQSLPALIEYYVGVGELRCSLRLPRAITEARSTEELQQIASIGPAFWNWNNVPVKYHDVLTNPPMFDEASTSFIQSAKANNQQPYEVQGVSHRRSTSHQTTDKRTDVSRSSWQRTSDHCPRYYDSNQPNYSRFDNTRKAAIEAEDPTIAAPTLRLFRERSIKTHVPRSNVENEPPKTSRRSQSVREKPRETGRKKSFLKSFFGTKEKEQKKRAGTPDLAHCTVFQVDQEAIKKSYGSAFEIGEPKFIANIYGVSSYTHNNNGIPTMRTFKPLPGEISNIGRPLPPKPGDDLCNAASALRLAKHNEGSPGPPKSPEARKAMKPPGPTMDLQSKQMCMDELRRKRLQTQHEMLNASPPFNGSPKQPRANEKFYRVPEQLRSPKRSHRLSVPDLQEIPTQAQESARALVSRLGRNEIGELGSINEGLITPVVRRKAFPIRHEISHEVNRSSTSISTESDNYGRMSESTGYGIIQAPSKQPLPSVQRKESELIWRRNSTKRIPSVPEPPSTTKSNRSGLIFPDRSGGAWGAITSEINARQAAKRRSAQNMNIETIVPVPSNSKASEPGLSEYTPLNDLADFEGERSNENIEDDAISVAGTVFNEPWDSTTWDNLLELATHKDEGMRRRIDPLVEDQENEMVASPSKQRVLDEKNGTNWDNNSHMSTMDSRRKPLSTMRRHDPPMTPMTSMMSLPRARSRYSQVDLTGSMEDLPNVTPSLSPFANGCEEITESYRTIQEYIEKLAEDPQSYTNRTLSVFISCNLESGETDPKAVIRNVRQFLTGMKNYYTKHGEGELHNIFIELRSRLTATQILNFDAIMESVLQRLILSQLWNHIYNVKIDEITMDGTLAAVAANIKSVREWPLEKFGFSCNYEVTLPTPQIMDDVKLAIKKMQHHYSPMKKVEYMMRGIGFILKSQRSGSPDMENNQKAPAMDKVIRWFVYILARCSLVSCEIEVWYIFELLPKQILEQADVFYYVNAMSAAVHLLKNESLLKNLEQDHEDFSKTATLPRVQPTKSTDDLFMKIAIPDVLSGKITYKSFPTLPNLTTEKFCRLIAHQLGITNPDVNGLYVITDGYEAPVLTGECLDMIRDKMNASAKSFYFAYKPHDVKVYWPSHKIPGLDLC